MPDAAPQMVSLPAWWILAGLGMQGIMVVAAMIVAYHKAVLWLGDRLTKFETTLASQATQLTSGVEQMRGLAARMEKTEERHVELAGSLQRLIGRAEVWQGPDRRGKT